MHTYRAQNIIASRQKGRRTHSFQIIPPVREMTSEEAVKV